MSRAREHELRPPFTPGGQWRCDCGWKHDPEPGDVTYGALPAIRHTLHATKVEHLGHVLPPTGPTIPGELADSPTPKEST